MEEIKAERITNVRVAIELFPEMLHLRNQIKAQIQDTQDFYSSRRKDAEALQCVLRPFQAWMIHHIVDDYLALPSSAIRRRVFWFWNLKGNIGKSLAIEWLTACLPGMVQQLSDVDKSTAVRDVSFSNRPSYIFLSTNVPRTRIPWVKYTIFENAGDRKYSQMKYESKASLGKSSQVCIITSNGPPMFYRKPEGGCWEETLTYDRWSVYEMRATNGKTWTEGGLEIWKNKTPKTAYEEHRNYADIIGHCARHKEFKYNTDEEWQDVKAKAPKARRGPKIIFQDLSSVVNMVEAQRTSRYTRLGVVSSIRARVRRHVLVTRKDADLDSKILAVLDQ